MTTLKDILAIKSSTQVRVSYRDTDQMGHAYYSQYLVWFEIGRTELIRDHGLNYRDLESTGVFLPVRECACRYLSPACYDDLLTIHTTIVSLSPSSIKFVYRIDRPEDGVLIAKGNTHHPFVSSERKIMRVGFQVFKVDKKT